MIQLTKNLFLSADKYQFIIVEERTAKSGEKKLHHIAFYPKLDMVFNFIFELNLKRELIFSKDDITNHTSLKEIAEDLYEELTNKLLEISADVKKWLAEQDKE